MFISRLRVKTLLFLLPDTGNHIHRGISQNQKVSLSHFGKRAASSVQHQIPQRNDIPIFDTTTKKLKLLLQNPDPQMATALDRHFKVIDYTMSGKHHRGHLMMNAFLTMKPDASDDDMEILKTIATSLELIQSMSLVVDDMVDGGQTRRGKPCWHLNPGVGPIAAVDGVALLVSGLFLVSSCLRNHHSYAAIMEKMISTLKLTCDGQYADILMNRNDCESVMDFSGFTMEKLKSIMRHKTGYFLTLPIELALILAGKNEQACNFIFKEILAEIGILFQMNNDYDDIFGKLAATGKIGTDIKEGKLTWFAIDALHWQDQADRMMFMAHYGRKEDESQDLVVRLFDKHASKSRFLSSMKKEEDKIRGRITLLNHIDPSFPTVILRNFLSRIKQ